MNSREKQERLAAAKRKVQEYRQQQQHRNEPEKNVEPRRESQTGNSVTVKLEREVQSFQLIPADSVNNFHGNGTVTLNIGESDPPSRASPAPSAPAPPNSAPIPPHSAPAPHSSGLMLPKPPTTIEFPDNPDDETTIDILPQKLEGLNQSSQEDDDLSTSNTNTSPVTTPNERIARASVVREWVESDTLTKSLHQDIQPPETELDLAVFESEEQPLAEENFIHRPTPNSTFQFGSAHNLEASRNENDLKLLTQELKELRQSNLMLKEHEREYIIQLQGVEKLIQTLTHEKQALQNEIATEFMPLKQKYSTLKVTVEELKVVISDLRSQLNSALAENEAKQKAFDDMQSAFIKVSASKRELESNWDIDQERHKIMEEALKEKSLRVEELIHGNQNQVQHEKALETVTLALEEELKQLKNKNIVLEKRLYDLMEANDRETRCSHEHHDYDGDHHKTKVPSVEHPLESVHVQRNSESHHHGTVTATDNGHEHDHHHGDSCDHHHDEHGKGSCEEDHHHHEGHDHDHSHDDGHGHHDHNHKHEDGHEHHDHDHDHDHRVILPTNDGPSPMEKKLARLEWENLTYREELDKLAANLKIKTVEATDCEKLRSEGDRLRTEVNRLEHLVIQLQGENDTIGDYISLYQSQKLVLKEKVREKDREMETLSRERAELKVKMEELNELLKNYHENTEDKEKPIEKLSELISTINNSSAASIHSCSECSGNLINI